MKNRKQGRHRRKTGASPGVCALPPAWPSTGISQDPHRAYTQNYYIDAVTRLWMLRSN